LKQIDAKGASNKVKFLLEAILLHLMKFSLVNELFFIELIGFVHREKHHFLWENLLCGNFPHTMDRGSGIRNDNYSKCHKYVPIESVSVTICRKPPNDFV